MAIVLLGGPWTLAASEICADALEHLGVIADGETASSGDMQTALRALNGVLKELPLFGYHWPALSGETALAWGNSQAVVLPADYYGSPVVWSCLAFLHQPAGRPAGVAGAIGQPGVDAAISARRRRRRDHCRAHAAAVLAEPAGLRRGKRAGTEVRRSAGQAHGDCPALGCQEKPRAGGFDCLRSDFLFRGRLIFTK